MKVQRGDIVLARYPFASGTGASRRPVLVVQSDAENRRLTNTIVAQITSNLRRTHEPTHLLIAAATPEGAQAGLLHDSLVSCINLATIREDRIDKIIGSLAPTLTPKLNACLKAALELP
jgi:mRNA-degrading endonuclease toxin of MazEF toxin-antitoxin module